MKKIFENPIMNISIFNSENILTVSGLDNVETALRDGVIKLDNKTLEGFSKVIKFTL